MMAFYISLSDILSHAPAPVSDKSKLLHSVVRGLHRICLGIKNLLSIIIHILFPHSRVKWKCIYQLLCRNAGKSIHYAVSYKVQ